MSDSFIAFHPAIEEPSKKTPFSSISSSTIVASIVKCCNFPLGSVNLKSTNSSVDPIDGNYEGKKFRINVKPKTGGMGESTLNSSITELFPCIAFEKKLHPKNYIDFMEKIMSVDLKSLKCIGGRV